MRTVRGIELTAAGRAFLDHPRSVLSQVKRQPKLHAAHLGKPCLTMGFLTGHELTWMPEAFADLTGRTAQHRVMISSQYSPLLASALEKGTVDAAGYATPCGLPLGQNAAPGLAAPL
jgi:LysR family hca operon transcriptional activator